MMGILSTSPRDVLRISENMSTVLFFGLLGIALSVPEAGLVAEHSDNDYVTLLQRQVHPYESSGGVPGGHQAKLQNLDSGMGLLKPKGNHSTGAIPLLQQERMVMEGLATSGGTCPLKIRSIPTVATIAVMAAVLAVTGAYVKSVPSRHGIITLGLLKIVLVSAARMMNVPDSHALGISLGRRPAWSGLFLGINRWGEMIGCVAMTIAMFRPNFWRNYFRMSMLFVPFIQCIGSLLYWYSTWHIPQTPQDLSESLSDKLSMLALASRILIGVGTGISSQHSVVYYQKIIPVEELPWQFQCRMLAVCLGTGLGPIVAGAGYALDSCPRTAVPRFEVAGGMQVMFLLTTFIAMALFLPSIDDLTGKSTEEPSERTELSKIIVITGLILGALYSFVGGSVEVSTPLLLEQNYGWSIAPTGFLTGISFLAGIPIWLLCQSTIGKMNHGTCVRVVGSFAALGTILLFRAPTKLLPNGIMLVVADLIIFPTINFVRGLVQGIMMQHVPSDNSSLFFNSNTIGMVMDLMLEFALGIGAVQSRWIIAVGGGWGQDGYAGTQLVCCICFLAVFEMGMNRSHVGQKSTH